MRRIVTLVPVLLLTLACSQATSAPADGTAPAPRIVRGSANLILNAEVEAAGNDVNNAYELIERLRPTMLRPRNLSGGSGAEYGIVAYVDDVRLGDLDQLKTVMRATVHEIRYISASDATTRWGTGLSNGVIQVRLKR